MKKRIVKIEDLTLDIAREFNDHAFTRNWHGLENEHLLIQIAECDGLVLDREYQLIVVEDDDCYVIGVNDDDCTVILDLGEKVSE